MKPASTLDAFVPRSIQCLREYNAKTFFSDLIAGLTVGLVALPLAMAFAISSGVPPQAGIYGAVIAGSPDGLISALQKLDAYSQRIPMNNPNPAQNSMFIVEPLVGNSLLNLFASHPPTEKRVAALNQMRAEFDPRRIIR